MTSIISLGTAQPAYTVSQAQYYALARMISCQSAKQEKTLEKVYKKSGVQSRATVLQTSPATIPGDPFYHQPQQESDSGPTTAQRMEMYNREITPLATGACQSALEQAGIDIGTVTHLVTASCTGFAAPGFDLQLFSTLGLSPNVQRTHVGFMGCHGALNALRVANSYCLSDSSAVVLLCAAELCSMHFQYGWCTNSVVSNALFADGAAALILRGADYDDSSDLVDSADFDDSAKRLQIQYRSAASYVVPDSNHAMSWQIGDAGFIMNLTSDVPDLIEANLPSFMDNWLDKQGLKLSDIKGWAVHPGGPRILDAVESALGLSPNDIATSRQVLAECGNMSSPTVLFILQRLIARGNHLPCVILGFGPGLTVEAALLT